MHELSICAALLGQVASTVQSHGARRVTRIVLRLGALSGVEPALLQAAYAQAGIGTPAENAELVIVDVPIRIRCRDCAVESDAAVNRLRCPACGGAETTLISGDEMMLETVDIVF